MISRFLKLSLFFMLTFLAAGAAMAGPRLAWDPSTGEATGYTLYYGENSGAYTQQMDVGNQLECALSDLSIKDGAKYFFAVKAYNDAGESDFSNEVSWESGDSTPPLPPQQLIAENGTLKWQANSESDLNAYHVYCGTSTRNYAPCIPVGTSTNYSLTGLDQETTYYLAVTAVDTSGNESGYSNEIQFAIPSPPAQEPAPTPTDSSGIRINAGGPEVTLNGLVWKKDAYFSGGSTYRTSQAISGITQDSIYQTERFAKEFSYQIPVLSGEYSVKLHFAEIYWKNSGKRVLNMVVEDSEGTITGYDIFQTAGALTADVKTFNNISVTDGILDIRFTTVLDNAKLSAIEVLPIENGAEAGADTQAPSVIISSPTNASAFTTQESLLSLAGTASDNIDIESVQWVNSTGGSGTTDGTSNWTISDVTLKEGENIITVQASDSAGNTGKKTLEVTYSPKNSAAATVYRINAGGPEVTLNGFRWNKDEFYSGGSTYSNSKAISGTSNDPLYQTERFGKELSYTLPMEAGIYTVKLHLAEIYWQNTGKRLFNVSIENHQAALEDYDIFSQVGASAADIKSFENIAVTDGFLNIDFTAGKENAKLSAIEIIPYEEITDTHPPSVLISSPTNADRFTTNQTKISLSGTASDNTDVVSIEWTNSTGGNGTASGTGNWSIPDVTLREGENVISIVAVDSAGNQGAQKLSVILDTQAPAVMITSPTNSNTYTTKNPNVEISGTASDDVDVVEVSWAISGGGSGTAVGTENWTILEALLKEGENMVAVEAVDSAGNIGSKTISVIYAPEKPRPEYRINVGGPGITLNGVFWAKDQYHSGGNLYSIIKAISGTSDDDLYQTERYGKSFSYKIPVEPGLYIIKLHFAEIYWNDIGKRVFDALIEGTQGKLDNFDIYANSGALAADVQIFDNISVDDGFLNIELSTKVDNAKISAIEIIGI